MTLRVRGVVSPPGAVAWQLAPDPDTWLHFEVRPWRVANGSIFTRPLRLRMAIEADAAQQWIAKAPRDAVVEFEVAALDHDSDSPQLALRLHGPVEDPALAALGPNAAPPPELWDGVFGTLIYDPGLDWFTGRAAWRGRGVEIQLSCDPEREGSRALDVARRLWADQERWHRLVEDALLREMLPLRNESWNDVGEEPMTAERFLASITLESVTTYPDGSVEFSHDDGDLFGGHAIGVSGTLDDGVQSVDL